MSSLGEPLTALLQRIVVTDNDIGVVEEAIHLLEAYTEGPYVILDECIDDVAEEFKPAVQAMLRDNG